MRFIHLSPFFAVTTRRNNMCYPTHGTDETQMKISRRLWNEEAFGRPETAADNNRERTVVTIRNREFQRKRLWNLCCETMMNMTANNFIRYSIKRWTRKLRLQQNKYDAKYVYVNRWAMIRRRCELVFLLRWVCTRTPKYSDPCPKSHGGRCCDNGPHNWP